MRIGPELRRHNGAEVEGLGGAEAGHVLDEAQTVAVQGKAALWPAAGGHGTLMSNLESQKAALLRLVALV